MNVNGKIFRIQNEFPKKLSTSKNLNLNLAVIKKPVLFLRKNSINVQDKQEAKKTKFGTTVVVFEKNNTKYSFNLKNENELLRSGNVYENIKQFKFRLDQLEKEDDFIGIDNSDFKVHNNLICGDDKNIDFYSLTIKKNDDKNNKHLYENDSLDISISENRKNSNSNTNFIHNGNNKLALLNAVKQQEMKKLTTSLFPLLKDNPTKNSHFTEEIKNIKKYQTLKDKQNINLHKNILFYNENKNVFLTNVHNTLTDNEKNEEENDTGEKEDIIFIKSLEQKKIKKSLENCSPVAKYDVCVICEQYISKSNSHNIELCNHKFCSKCGKLFYEDKIENGEYQLQCPIYKCKNNVFNEEIKKFVSEKHFENLGNNKNIFDKLQLETNDVSTGNVSVAVNPKKTNRSQRNSKAFLKNQMSSVHELNLNNLQKTHRLKQQTTYLETFKNYSQKHVIDVSFDDSYLLFNKFKEHYCSKCHEPALYGKLPNSKIIKCLNCFQSLCKYCFKIITKNHYDLSSTSYCKIFFRKSLNKTGLLGTINENENTKWTYVKKFMANFLIVCINFLLIVIYLCHITTNRKFQNNLFNYILVPFKISVLIIIVIMSCILMPFFPMISLILDFKKQ